MSSALRVSWSTGIVGLLANKDKGSSCRPLSFYLYGQGNRRATAMLAVLSRLVRAVISPRLPFQTSKQLGHLLGSELPPKRKEQAIGKLLPIQRVYPVNQVIVRVGIKIFGAAIGNLAIGHG